MQDWSPATDEGRPKEGKMKLILDWNELKQLISNFDKEYEQKIKEAGNDTTRKFELTCRRAGVADLYCAIVSMGKFELETGDKK